MRDKSRFHTGLLTPQTIVWTETESDHQISQMLPYNLQAILLGQCGRGQVTSLPINCQYIEHGLFQNEVVKIWCVSSFLIFIIVSWRPPVRWQCHSQRRARSHSHQVEESTHQTIADFAVREKPEISIWEVICCFTWSFQLGQVQCYLLNTPLLLYPFPSWLPPQFDYECHLVANDFQD